MSKVTTILLTGGKAQRMWPLSEYECKAMISFMGKPLLLHLIHALKRYNFTDIVCTSPGKKGEISEYFANGKEYDVDIKYYVEKKWSGTAGSVKNLANELKENIAETIVVIYGDSLLKANYNKMLEFHRQRRSLCTILYHRPNFESFLYEYHDNDDSYENSGKRTNYGVMDLALDNRIIYVEEKPLLEDIKKKFLNPVANATVYILEKLVLEHIPADCSFDFPKDLFPALLKKGVRLFGFDIEDGYRVDIGTLYNYFQTQFDILRGKVEFDFYFPFLEKGMWIAKSSRDNPIKGLRKPILIGENCKIDQDAEIECSIIGNNVEIGKFSTIRNSIILDDNHIGECVNIAYSIIGRKSLIGDNVLLSPNSVLGSNCNLKAAQLS